jgi:uncharacterized protein (DUF1330 family)
MLDHDRSDRPEEARPMTEAFAIAHLRTPQLNEPVLEYLERIDGTLAPFGGEFLVHGPQVEAKERDWPGTVVVIRFPGADFSLRPPRKCWSEASNPRIGPNRVSDFLSSF